MFVQSFKSMFRNRAFLQFDVKCKLLEMMIIMKLAVLFQKVEESQFIDFMIFHVNVHVSLGQDQARPTEGCNTEEIKTIPSHFYYSVLLSS